MLIKRFKHWVIVFIILFSIIIVSAFLSAIFIDNRFLFQFGLTVAVLIELFYLYKFVVIKEINSKKRFFLYFIILYSVMIIETFLFDHLLTWKLAQFDLDGDSIFALSEQTSEQIKYMQRWSNDTSRKLIAITAIPYSFICTLLFNLILFTIKTLKNRMSLKSSGRQSPE